jgi:hypothetical protein
MSNLLKSKFLLGVMIVAVLFVGVVAFLPGGTAAAANCSITSTLRVGSTGAQVVCLQTSLGGLKADGSFGPKTKAAVVAWQTKEGLSADGVFGPKSNAQWVANAGNSMNFPVGCASNVGFSPSTGQSCASGQTVTTTYPAGCSSTSGYSPTTGASCATGVVTTSSGPISVALSADNPASGYAINNQATADMLHFTFNGVGTVTSVQLHRTGISSQNTLDNVYLFEGNTRITDGYSFNNNGDLTINSLAIAVNGPTEISVRADVDSTAASDASTIGINLTGYTAGTTATTANLIGNVMYLGVGSAATAYLNSNNTVNSPTVNAGTSSYTVWSAPLQVNTRSIWLKGANFRMTGSAPADALQNIHLFVDGVDAGKIATTSTINGSTYAMFDFTANPVSLSTGSHTVDIRADVVKGSSYNVVVSMQQAADLVLYDSQVGVNIAVTTSTGAAYGANSSGTIYIAGGSASVVIDPTFQVMTNITGGATNVAIARFKVHGYGEDVKVTSLDVTPVLTNETPSNLGGLQNLTLYFNGSQVGSSYNWTTGSGSHTFQLGSQMILPAGVDSYIEVRADLQDSGSHNYTAGTVSADLTLETTNAQGQTSHTPIGFPASEIDGTSLTVQTGLLAVSKNTGYADTSVNPNTANVRVGSFTLQNQSSSEGVRITSLLVGLVDKSGNALSSSSYPALTNFSNLKTSETSGSGNIPIQPSASNTFSVNFTLAPGATDVLDIFADTSSYATAANTFSTTLEVTSLGAKSNVSISQNGDANAKTGQSIALATGVVTNPPTLLATTSTASQYISAATSGATNVARATFNIASTGGSAAISEMKFTVNSEDVSTAASAGVLTSTGDVAMTNTANAGFAVGDFVKITGSGTTAYGIVASVPTTAAMHIYITSVGSGTPSLIAVIPSTVTAITVNGVSAPVVGGVAYLTGLNITVPNGSGGLNQDVYTSYSPVGTNGIISGATSRIALEYMKYTSGGATGTLCTSTFGSCTTPASAAAVITTAVAAPTMTLVGSSPIFTVATPSNHLAVTNVEAIDVMVTANAKGNIALNTLKINLATSTGTCYAGVTGAACAGGSLTGAQTDVIVKDSNNTTVATTNTALTGTNSTSTTITFTNGYTISGSQTFKIYVPITYVTATAVGTAQLTTTLATGAAALTWTDLAGNATVAQTGVATSSYPTSLIPSYPSTTSATIYN